ncbi:sulfurtransferase [Gordoniibacillus kamchatkensis]|uniref:Sulfurtransferase n=1 Tax=Gordoniibacillus kamchatkensis TaxID=1590651 RepID=A0ABR5AAW9_9BACL|nr:rhodanese-like domain-containing protein [Paenibacillus sp. VKM B-2647]KIL38205.1 sulfurtransferase [Paenibacillus sp. VKM B-2647]
MQHIDAAGFVKLLQSEEGKELCVIDVREPEEWDYYHLEEARLMPMNTIPAQLDDIPDDRDVYIVCAHGVRSQMVCGFLEQQGRHNAINVIGGMAAVAAQLGFQYD